MSTINRTTLRDRCRQAMAGVDKHLAGEPSIPLGGSTETPTVVKQSLQNMVTAADATQVARGEWIDASQAEKGLRDETIVTLSALKSFVLLKFGDKDTATLADFGFTARKQAQTSVDTKATAVEKSLATRAARHTMGPRQKAKVKGTVAPAAAPAPAPVAEPVAAPVGPMPVAASATQPASTPVQPAASPAVVSTAHTPST
jgi:hypothetical protein